MMLLFPEPVAPRDLRDLGGVLLVVDLHLGVYDVEDSVTRGESPHDHGGHEADHPDGPHKPS
jgi:hypothetical protein